MVKALGDAADDTRVASDVSGSTRMTACPACGAALRPGSPWCTLCYHDLRPPEPVQASQPIRPATLPTTAPPNAAYGPVAADPLTQPLIDFLPAPGGPAPGPEAVRLRPAVASEGASWPCATCGSPNPLNETCCAVCGAEFLAAVRKRPSLVLPVVGDLGRLSRSQRLWAAFVAAMVVILPIALITLVLSQRPPKTDLTPVTVVTPTSAPAAPEPVTPSATP